MYGKIIEVEINKIKDARFIVEVHNSDWLANVVLVQKKNGKWRVCIGFTDLNKACPKDPYPFRYIDLLVYSIVRHELLSFMDAYSRYN